MLTPEGFVVVLDRLNELMYVKSLVYRKHSINIGYLGSFTKYNRK